MLGQQGRPRWDAAAACRTTDQRELAIAKVAHRVPGGAHDLLARCRGTLVVALVADHDDARERTPHGEPRHHSLAEVVGRLADPLSHEGEIRAVASSRSDASGPVRAGLADDKASAASRLYRAVT